MADSDRVPATYAAVDLGATSGRVIVGRIADDRIALHEVARFANTPLKEGATLRWDVRKLYADILDGLGKAVREAPGLTSLAVDSWGVDYGLLRQGRLVDNPYHYRDARTAAAAAEVHNALAPRELFRRGGVRPMAINTLYQLHDDRRTGRLAAADTVLMIPQLIEYWLTGARRTEVSMASTTGLLDASAEWDTGLVHTLGIPRPVLPELVRPGAEPLLVHETVRETLGADGPLGVTAVASHDTASAVAATPLGPEDAYISCGTWGLAGIELDRPVVDDAAYASGFTNELGLGGAVCFQRNLMGLWLLTQCMTAWAAAGMRRALPELLAGADTTPPAPTFDVDDPGFTAPGAMPAKISAWYRERGMAPPDAPEDCVRRIVDSLAASFASAVRDASRLAARPVHRIRLVGGGSRNSLLCQAIADRSGLPVLAGMPEATAMGNILVQAAAEGRVRGDTASLRTLAARSSSFATYRPAT